jgi:hypothetical protein
VVQSETVFKVTDELEIAEQISPARMSDGRFVVLDVESPAAAFGAILRATTFNELAAVGGWLACSPSGGSTADLAPFYLMRA